MIIIENIRTLSTMAKPKKKTSTKKTGPAQKVAQIRQKLKNTPFSKMEDMKKASQEIQQKVWERVEEARVFNEIVEKPEYKFIKDEFKEGLKCKYGDADAHLVRVYSEGKGIEIDINPDLASEAAQSGSFVESLIRSTGETFSKSYYKSKGILPNELKLEDVISAMKKASKDD